MQEFSWIRPAWVACAAVALAAAPPVVAQAQAPAPVPGPAAAPSVVAFDIAAQPLAGALRHYADQSGHQVLFDEEAVAGRQAPAVSGRYPPREALERLLAGSGIQVVGARPGVFTLRAPAPSPGAAGTAAVGATLPAVIVTGRTERGDATEGSGAYAGTRVSLGKGQDLRQLPQSVTVVTRQRIEDQALGSVGEVMEQTTGVTVDYRGAGGLGGTANSFYARGFQMTSVQIDGAAVDAFSQQAFDPNLAMYDSVQVIRGADGLFGGNGEPGGSINLVRKRPLAEGQVLAAATVGRWNRRQVELDATGPLALEGRVRGRAVLAHSDRDFFYDGADARNTLLYGILETDVTATTRLSFGASHDRTASTPWRSGLPRASNGADLGLPRNTALMASWSHYDKTVREAFAQLEQRLSGDWRVRADLNVIKVTSSSRLANGEGAVDPATGLGSELNGSSNDFGSLKKALDVNVGGSFPLFGLRHKVLVGADWARIRDSQDTWYSETEMPAPGLNVYDFHPDRVPVADFAWKTRSFPAYGATQKGLYARLNLALTERLTAVAGARYASYDYQSPMVRYDRQGAVVSQSMTAYKESGILTPYGGLLFELDPRWTAYGSIAEIHKSQASRLGGPLPGAPLDAITGRNLELGVKGSLAEERLNAAFALYRIERNGEGVRDPAYPSTPIGDVGLNCCWIAQGEVVSQGIDTEISGELARGWQLFAGYTYNRNRDKSSASRAAYHSVTPKHLFKLWSTYRVPGTDLTLGGGANLQSATFVSGTARSFNPASGQFDGPNVPFDFSQRGYAVWNASAQYRLDRHWTVVLNVNNVFDKVYYRAVGSSSGSNWYGEPRNLMLTVRGRF